jgi:hypothetical protein
MPPREYKEFLTVKEWVDDPLFSFSRILAKNQIRVSRSASRLLIKIFNEVTPPESFRDFGVHRHLLLDIVFQAHRNTPPTARSETDAAVKVTLGIRENYITSEDFILPINPPIQSNMSHTEQILRNDLKAYILLDSNGGLEAARHGNYSFIHIRPGPNKTPELWIKFPNRKSSYLTIDPAKIQLDL